MKPIRHVLIVAPRGSNPAAALQRASALLPPDGRITVVDVLPQLGVLARAALPSSLEGLYVRERELELHEAIERVRGHSIHTRVRVLIGGAAASVIRAVLDDGADLLMKVSRDAAPEEPTDALEMKLLRKCPCPVWVISSAGSARPLSRVLAAVDPLPEGDEEGRFNHAILGYAFQAAKAHEASVTVMHAWQLVADRLLRRHLTQEAYEALVRDTEQRARQLLEEALEPIAPIQDQDIRVVRGEAPSAIMDLATALPADLVVIGTVARTGIGGHIIGNTAELVLRGLRGEVLAIKPDSFVSPLAPRTLTNTAAS